jgi:sugar phosphate isomerase/epimerase
VSSVSRLPVGVASWFLPVRGPAALVWARVNGFQHIHVDLVDVDLGGREALNHAADATGVRIAGLAINELEFLRPGDAKGRDVASRALDTAAELGVSYAYLPSFGRALIESDRDLMDAAALLRFAAQIAGPLNVTVATENTLSATQLSFLFDLIEDHPVELLFDTQNLFLHGVDTLEVLRSHGHRVVRFAHVKDGVGGLGNCPLFSGTAEIRTSLIALLERGFRGTLVIERDYRRTDDDAARADAECLARFLHDAQELLAAAEGFA